MNALVQAVRKAGRSDDILNLLIEARYEENQPLSDEEIRDQLLLMVVAGHETTGISIAWVLYG